MRLGREAAPPGACLVCPPQFVGRAKYPKLSRLGGSREAMEKEQAQTPRPQQAAEWGLGKEMCKTNDAGMKSCFSVNPEL